MSAAQAQAQAQLNPYDVDKRFYIAPMFSYTFSNHERGTDNGLDGTIAVGAASVAGNTLPQTCASTSGLDPGAITTRLGLP